RPLFASLVLLAVELRFDGEKMLRGRNDDLFAVREHLAVADHRRVQEDVWRVPLFNRNLDQLDRAGEMDELVTVQVFALNAEENIAIRRRSVEHHGGLLTGAKGVLIDDDFKAAVAISQLGRRVSR